MSIQSEITRISGNVADALTAIAAKGVTVPQGSNSDDLATLIAQIEGGGDEPVGPTYETIVPLQTINCTVGLSNGAYGGYITNYTEYTTEGQKYRVIFDGTEYTPLTAAYYGGTTNYLYIGDANVEASSSATLTYPFDVMLYGGQTFYLGVRGSGSHTLQVDKIIEQTA